MQAPESLHEPLPRVLFVDDEQRVLNSMRIMFRRRFELHFATSGAAAIDIVKANPIDVIVADHRMPQMTGVEVLSVVRDLSPRTVRILLTGYADLDAIEGSINDGEVFRFLTKPCAPTQLRESVELAIRAARANTENERRVAASHRIDPQEQLAHDILESEPPPNAVQSGPAPMRDLTRTMTEHELATTDVIDPPKTASVMPLSEYRGPVQDTDAANDSVIVFSADPSVMRAVTEGAQNRFPVHIASNIVQVVRLLTEHQSGVLVTDVTQDRKTIQTMTASLKRHLPELVTVVISEHRDALDMVWLINHGQIFRFLRKPVLPGRCGVSVQAALQHHRALRSNPVLNSRHVVDAADDSGVFSGVFEKLKSVRRLWG
jgi:DNA-binding NtrC family response regulator